VRVRSQFSHHYERRDDDEVNAALREATVVLDTNVLLGLYRASPGLRTKRLEVFKAIGSRIFVPHQVGVEFHRNRREVVAGIGAAYDGLRTAVGQLQNAVKAFGGEGRYDESAARVKELVDPLLGRIVDGLKELEKNDPHRIDLSDDPILAELEDLLDDRQVGQAPRAKKLAARVREFEEIRVPLRLPPGYEDAYKIANRGPAAAAGDYLLWCEVLAYARKNETDVVLVTDDAKSDWWQTGTGGPDVPHPLLVSEFRRETGQDYCQLSTRDLLRRADVLDITVTSQDLEEEDELAATAEAEGALELLADFGSHLTLSAAATSFENDFHRRFAEPWKVTESQSQRLIDAAQRALGPGADEALASRLRDISRLIENNLAARLTPEVMEAMERLRQQLYGDDGTQHGPKHESPHDDAPDEGDGPAE
jgi:hypothetical protein